MDSNGVAALFLTPGTEMINGSKHISIRDGEQIVIDDYALIQKKIGQGQTVRTSCALTVNPFGGFITLHGRSLHANHARQVSPNITVG